MKDHPSQFVHVRTESVNRFSRCMRQKQLQPRRRRDWNRRKKSRKEKKTVLREIVITATKEEIIVDVMTEEMTDAITVIRADVMTDVIIVDVMTDVTTARTVRQFQSQSWKVRSHRETKEKVRMTLRRKIKTSAMTKTA